MSNTKRYSGASTVHAVIDFDKFCSLYDTPQWWQNFVRANRPVNTSKEWTTAAVNRQLGKFKAWIVENREGDVSAVYFRTEGGMVQFMLTYS